MRILLSGGGTAGHINPALAIARVVLAHEPDSQILFVGTRNGMERRLVPREGFDIEYIEVMGLRRKLTLENVKVAVNYFTSIRDAGRIIDRFRPDAVVGTGGYVCAPVIKAALKRNIPTLIHEQNVFPGLAIKMLAKKASVTAISFDETRSMMKAGNMVLTGNPLRPDLFESVDKEALRRELELDSRPVVLAFGGSLGAERLNDALVEMIKNGVKNFNLVAATGEKHYKEVTDALLYANVTPNVKLLPYIYNMKEMFAAADLVVCRAGAITVSELCALGKASVLIPSPYVAHNHQEYNARYLEKNGAARVLLESELNGESLRRTIEECAANSAGLEEMRRRAKSIGIADGGEKIYAQLKKLTDKAR